MSGSEARIVFSCCWASLLPNSDIVSYYKALTNISSFNIADQPIQLGFDFIHFTHVQSLSLSSILLVSCRQLTSLNLHNHALHLVFLLFCLLQLFCELQLRFGQLFLLGLELLLEILQLFVQKLYSGFLDLAGIFKPLDVFVFLLELLKQFLLVFLRFFPYACYLVLFGFACGDHRLRALMRDRRNWRNLGILNDLLWLRCTQRLRHWLRDPLMFGHAVVPSDSVCMLEPDDLFKFSRTVNRIQISKGYVWCGLTTSIGVEFVMFLTVITFILTDY